MKHYLAMTAALAALSACSGGEKKVEAAASASPAMETSSAAPVAAAPVMADVDMVQAGKWSMTISSMGTTLPTSEICVEKTMTYAEAQKLQEQKDVTCSENTYRREGDKIIGHAVCTAKRLAGAGEMKITTDSVLTGDLKAAYTVEQTARIEPAPAGMTEMKSTITAKRLGDCAPAK